MTVSFLATVGPREGEGLPVETVQCDAHGVCAPQTDSKLGAMCATVLRLKQKLDA
jgi:hypothetical protein